MVHVIGSRNGLGLRKLTIDVENSPQNRIQPECEQEVARDHEALEIETNYLIEQIGRTGVEVLVHSSMCKRRQQQYYLQ